MLSARRAIKKFYDGVMVGEDPEKPVRTRQTSLRGNGVWVNGHRVRARPLFTAKELYTQLVYLKRLGDEAKLDKANDKRKKAALTMLFPDQSRPVADLAEWKEFRHLVDSRFLKHSEFAWVGEEFWLKAKGQADV
jgi:hypothetical protein